MIQEDLFYLQQNFKCNKDNYNSFGKFKYRNLEQILYELKPLLKERKCTITFENDMVLIGDRYYIKSKCILSNSDGESLSSIGWAREDEQRAGMSESQSTGCAMSYSNKYSICLLLAISEEIDPEALDNSKQTKEQPKQNNLEVLTQFCSAQKIVQGTDIPELKKFYDFYCKKVNEWKSFNPETQFKKWMDKKKYPISA